MNNSARESTQSNERVAALLQRVGDLLHAQGASSFRARAYFRAADTLRSTAQPVADILAREGPEALQRIRTVGPAIAAVITEIVHTGRLHLLELLEGVAAPEEAFSRIAGIGPVLAHRIHARLHVTSLEDLEAAAHDGRLQRVAGFGPRRVQALRGQLASMLRKGGRMRARRQLSPWETGRPSVAALLDVDTRYQKAAEADTLKKIAPRRFNSGQVAWLPVLHLDLDGWHMTAMYSNTAQAHQLGRTRDWVVIFYERHHHRGQCTVVTERRGELEGWRVVRGRERECAYHQVAVTYGDAIAIDNPPGAAVYPPTASTET